MFCTNCGSECNDNAVACPKCGCALKKPAPAGTCPPSHMTGAILVTLFCCVPGGIAAIINAAGVQSAWNRGEVEVARKKSESAQNWITASAIIGVVIIILNVVIQVAANS